MRLEEGDIIELKPGMTVYTETPKTLVYSNHGGDWSLTTSEVKVGEDRTIFGYLQGRFAVTKCFMGGGGTGHGPHDTYPDGWHVFAEKMDNRDIKVDFYQSGCFTAMILPEEITPVGKAEVKWVEKGDEA